MIIESGRALLPSYIGILPACGRSQYSTIYDLKHYSIYREQQLTLVYMSKTFS